MVVLVVTGEGDDVITVEVDGSTVVGLSVVVDVVVGLVDWGGLVLICIYVGTHETLTFRGMLVFLVDVARKLFNNNIISMHLLF